MEIASSNMCRSDIGYSRHRREDQLPAGDTYPRENGELPDVYQTPGAQAMAEAGVELDVASLQQAS